jgi:hypothetical protein
MSTSKFYDNQINTGIEIISKFLTVSWVMFIALLQSGKTGTYMFTAFEMFREKKIKKILIICGNSETELKNQVNEDLEKNLSNYRRYLRNVPEIDAEDLSCEIKANIEIYFSNELTIPKNIKKYKAMKDLLIVWEESHFAQDAKNRPNKFLNKIGISANGKKEYLEERNIKVLSVSATPFSEFSDYNHYFQEKGTVYMIPSLDSQYIGIKEFKENNCFIGFEDPLEGLEDALRNNDGKTYGIVRCVDKGKVVLIDRAKELCDANGWKYEFIDMHHREFGIENLENEPDQKTVVFIKGMFKMGKVVPKRYVSFVMNMNSKTTNTDSLLQGLAGRMCGYVSRGANINVKIYFHQKFIDSNEITKYLEFHEREQIIPNRANNIISNRNSCDSLKHTIPVKINAEDFECDNVNDNESIIKAIQKCFDENRVHNHNNDVDSVNIINQVNNMIDNTKYEFTKRNHLVASCMNGPEKIGRLFNDRDDSGSYGQSCGFNQNDIAEPHQICFWPIKNDNYNHLNIKKGDVFLLFRIEKDADTELVNIPKTKDKCAFHQEIVHEDGTSEESNGAYSQRLSCASATNVNVMENELSEFIKLSLDPAYPLCVSRCIRSEKSADNSYKGIVVTAEVLKALKPKGSIYNKFLETFNVKLSVNRVYGNYKGKSDLNIRLKKIEW